MFYMFGKYVNAKVFTNKCEMEARQQILELLDTPVAKDSQIRIMPDVHAGKGCVIGFTMTINDKIVPNLVGVDIGCGMSVFKLGKIGIDYDELDDVIREYVPAGTHIHNNYSNFVAYAPFLYLNELHCKDVINLDRAKASIGTLGGGNHFIEIDVDDEGNKYLVIHSGSRHLGVEVCKYYQNLAEKQYEEFGSDMKQKTIEVFKALGREQEIEESLRNINAVKQQRHIPKDLRYIEGADFIKYLHDMQIVQEYATVNRWAIGKTILQHMDWDYIDNFETIHNYINVEDKILRKGAVSAKQEEELIIPMNMRDGSLLCIGKGNKDWNYSAPHGAGRVMSRSAAKQQLTMDEFQESMKDIYSTSVTPSTIDESPMAYKSMNDILDCIGDTVEVKKIIKPLYNFKAGE